MPLSAYNLQITNKLVRHFINLKDVYVHKGIQLMSSVILHAKGWNVNAIDNIFDEIDDPWGFITKKISMSDINYDFYESKL